MKKLTNKLWWFFLDHINWCHPVYHDGTEKPDSKLYYLYCLAFWPIPWMEEKYGKQPCWCCASVRGLIYGLLMGFAAGYFWR